MSQRQKLIVLLSALYLVLCPLQVRYRVDNTFSGRFRIDEVSGVILTRGSFENLDGQRLTLTVRDVILHAHI